MIVNPNNANINLSRLDNYVDSKKWSRIRSVFLTALDFVFNNEADFNTKSVWNNAIGNDYIVPIHHIKESENLSEDAVYRLSIHDIEEKTMDGKIRLYLKLNCPIEYHNELLNYDKKQYNIIIAMDGGVMLASLNDTQITGLETDQISIERMRIADQPAWTLIKIELNNIDNIKEYEPGLKPEDLKNIDVVINNVTHTGTTDISFHVEDRICGIDIEGLVSAVITLIDVVNGTATHGTFTDNGDGNYTITTSVNLYEGSINIFNEDYNGTGIYEFSEYVLPQYNPTQYSNTQYTIS